MCAPVWFEGEGIMLTSEQCRAYAAEYELHGLAHHISIRRATALLAISQSLTTLADQLLRLNEIEEDERSPAGRTFLSTRGSVGSRD